jgi:hypothetical protein
MNPEKAIHGRVLKTGLCLLTVKDSLGLVGKNYT